MNPLHIALTFALVAVCLCSPHNTNREYENGGYNGGTSENSNYGHTSSVSYQGHEQENKGHGQSNFGGYGQGQSGYGQGNNQGYRPGNLGYQNHGLQSQGLGYENQRNGFGHGNNRRY